VRPLRQRRVASLQVPQQGTWGVSASRRSCLYYYVLDPCYQTRYRLFAVDVALIQQDQFFVIVAQVLLLNSFDPLHHRL
jgi:hypothetical protein